MVREVNAAAMAIATQSEGCVLHAYRDAKGVLTAGWGHTGPDVKPGMVITQAQADAWRIADMARAAEAVDRLVQVSLTDNQFSALAEFTFNVGIGNFAGSTLLKRLNKRDYASVPGQLLRWTKAGKKVLLGLVARRAREVQLWSESEHITTQRMAQASPHVAISTAVVPAPLVPTPPSMIERARAWLHRKAA